MESNYTEVIPHSSTSGIFNLYDANYFNIIPHEIISDLALSLDINNIINLCKTSKRFNDVICNNNLFWKNKVEHDYGPITFDVTDWKLFYINFSTIWLMGINTVSNVDFSDAFNILKIDGLYGTTMAVGDGNYYAIDSRHNVWVWGMNIKGELGLGHKNFVNSPQLLNGIQAKNISYGNSMGPMLIDINNNVLIISFNDADSSLTKFIRIPDIKAKYVSGGWDHSALIDMDDNIWVFGKGNHGQLGLGNYESVNKFIRLPKLKAKQIECGFFMTILIDLENNIWSFGDNSSGQLGVGNVNIINTNIPVQIQSLKAKQISARMSNHVLVIDIHDYVWEFGNNILNSGKKISNKYSPTPLLTHNSIHMKAKRILASYNSSMIIDINNDLYALGYFEDFINSNYFDVLTPILGYKVREIFGSGDLKTFIGIQIEQ